MAAGHMKTLELSSSAQYTGKESENRGLPLYVAAKKWRFTLSVKIGQVE